MSGADLAVIASAVFVGAFVKSVTGMGLPLVAIPIMSIFVPTETAVAVLSIPTVAQNLYLVVAHRRWRSAARGLPAFCAAGVVGSLIGTYALDVVDERVLKLALLTMVGEYLATAITRPDVAIGERLERSATVPVGAIAGAFQGAIGISGPVVATWYDGLRLPRHAFVFSITTVFLLTGTAQAAVLGAQGKFAGRWGAVALVGAIVLVTVPLGSRLRDRLPLAAFRKLVFVLLAASCVGLSIDLVSSLV